MGESLAREQHRAAWLHSFSFHDLGREPIEGGLLWMNTASYFFDIM